MPGKVPIAGVGSNTEATVKNRAATDRRAGLVRRSINLHGDGRRRETRGRGSPPTGAPANHAAFKRRLFAYAPHSPPYRTVRVIGNVPVQMLRSVLQLASPNPPMLPMPGATQPLCASTVATSSSSTAEPAASPSREEQSRRVQDHKDVLLNNGAGGEPLAGGAESPRQRSPSFPPPRADPATGPSRE